MYEVLKKKLLCFNCNYFFFLILKNLKLTSSIHESSKSLYALIQELVFKKIIQYDIYHVSDFLNKMDLLRYQPIEISKSPCLGNKKKKKTQKRILKYLLIAWEELLYKSSDLLYVMLIL